MDQSNEPVTPMVDIPDPDAPAVWPPNRIVEVWADVRTWAFPAGFAWNIDGIFTIQIACFGIFINVPGILALLPLKGTTNG